MTSHTYTYVFQTDLTSRDEKFQVINLGIKQVNDGNILCYILLTNNQWLGFNHTTTLELKKKKTY